VLLALVTTALADRQGRRRILAVSFAGVCLANAATAVAPNLVTFTAAQLVVRAFVNSTIVVAGIAVIEEAPEDARAFAATMFALASGAGYAASVVLLPLADIGPEAWRMVRTRRRPALHLGPTALLVASWARRGLVLCGSTAG
jgi:MFS family permease